MRTWSLGPTVATLLLGVGAAAQQAAAEPCKGPKCGAPQRDGPRARAREAALLTSRARGGVYELPAAAAPEARPAPAAPPAANENPYDVAGLAETPQLAREPAAVAAARATHMGRALRAASTAYAAPLTASQDTCMGARTFGVQFMGFGVSFATTWQDRQCRRLKNARELFALGHREAAVQLLCLDDEVYAAMERAGTPCPLVQFTRAEPAPPPPPEQTEPPPLMTFDDVLFDFDRSTLRPEASRILDPLLAMLRADPSMRIDIEGHTDWVGSDAYNQGLSERRARAVVNWLVAHGISRDRLTSEGRGESEPIAGNQTREGRQLNRRVEIHRL